MAAAREKLAILDKTYTQLDTPQKQVLNKIKAELDAISPATGFRIGFSKRT
ncbi:hypothetical protein QTI27_35670 [Variovorax sp. J31P216]|nr:hypothetical protein [Variovorax sp. J31P216]